MIKTICDACGNENAGNKFSYLCHLDDHIGLYSDGKGNIISGRSIDIDLCNACYNKIVGAAVKEFKKINPNFKEDSASSFAPIAPVNFSPFRQ